MNEKPKILISSRSFGKINSDALDLLKKNGLNPILNPYGRKLTEDEIIGLMDDAVGIIAGTENITRKIIESNKNLKVISRYGIGLDNIDMGAVKQHNIIVYTTVETSSTAVAELTITLILTLLKKIRNVDISLRNNQWKPEFGYMLNNKTVGILGLGNIGKKVVMLIRSFNVKILTFDIKPDKNFIKRYDISVVSLDELLEKSDIVTIHIPLSNHTKHLLNKKNLSKMKETAFLINTARGGIVKEEDLYHILREKRIAGAAIDVFENEPDVGKLKELDNVILTPHIGTYTVETRRDMEMETSANLINGLKRLKII
ncbi:MAG: phosphoglycerate dehydrogenase [Candidatus Thermoplasmatota archaeon]